MLSVVHAVVVCLSVRLSVCLQIMPHDRPETLVFKWDVLQVAEFLLTSASRGPSAISEPLVIFEFLVIIFAVMEQRSRLSWLYDIEFA